VPPSQPELLQGLLGPAGAPWHHQQIALPPPSLCLFVLSCWLVLCSSGGALGDTPSLEALLAQCALRFLPRDTLVSSRQGTQR